MGEKRRRLSRLLLFAVVLAAFVLFGFGPNERIFADEPLNPDEVQIFYLEDTYVDYIGELPADCMTEYQIRTESRDKMKQFYELYEGNEKVSPLVT